MRSTIDNDVFTIDPDSVVPLYHQIKQNLRSLVDNEVLLVGDALPSERELSDLYGVNRLTLRRAITELVSEGVLRREHGVGTFVAHPKLTQVIGHVLGFSERTIEARRTPSSRVISMEVVPAPHSVAHRLRMEPGAAVYKLVRLRCADEEPVMLETVFLSQDRFPDLDAVDFSTTSLYLTLAQKFNCRIVEAEEMLEPVIMTGYEVEILDAKPHTPGLLVESLAYDDKGNAVEFGKSIVRGDKSRFYFHIKRQA
jgi:GntR family transcriptional regulator